MYNAKKQAKKSARRSFRAEANSLWLEAIVLQADAEYELQWRQLAQDLREACGYDY